MNAKNPIVEQLHNCNSDRERADVLLRCPDAVLLKYGEVFAGACRRVSFDAGERFVVQRIAAMCKTRSEVGALPGGLALELETLRAELAAYAAGAPVFEQMEVAAPPWPMDAPP